MSGGFQRRDTVMWVVVGGRVIGVNRHVVGVLLGMGTGHSGVGTVIIVIVVG